MASEAMETGSSGTSRLPMMEAPIGVDGDTTPRTSAMQVRSLNEVFQSPGGNTGFGVLDRPSVLPPRATTLVSAVSCSSGEASAAGARNNSATSMHSSLLAVPPQ